MIILQQKEEFEKNVSGDFRNQEKYDQVQSRIYLCKNSLSAYTPYKLETFHVNHHILQGSIIHVCVRILMQITRQLFQGINHLLPAYVMHAIIRVDEQSPRDEKTPMMVSDPSYYFRNVSLFHTHTQAHTNAFTLIIQLIIHVNLVYELYIRGQSSE